MMIRALSAVGDRVGVGYLVDSCRACVNCEGGLENYCAEGLTDLGLLAVDGTLVNVGVPVEPVAVAAHSLVAGRRSLAGSMIGGIAETQEMLEFCSAHAIAAEIETVDAATI